jgi:hypothetical protein
MVNVFISATKGGIERAEQQKPEDRRKDPAARKDTAPTRGRPVSETSRPGTTGDTGTL